MLHRPRATDRHHTHTIEGLQYNVLAAWRGTDSMQCSQQNDTLSTSALDGQHVADALLALVVHLHRVPEEHTHNIYKQERTDK